VKKWFKIWLIGVIVAFSGVGIVQTQNETKGMAIGLTIIFIGLGIQIMTLFVSVRK